MTVLLDTGPLVALLDERDQYHEWAKIEMANLRPPFLTCEPVITEAFHLLRTLPLARKAILEMSAQGVLTTPFQLSANAHDVRDLVERYSNVPMSLADACLVCMSESSVVRVLFTVDSDFRIYRRHKRQAIPLLIPPGV